MARFFDGERAAAHDVAPQLDAQTLLIRTADGTILARWPIADIIADEPVVPGDEVTLARRKHPARLRTDDTVLLSSLAGAGVRLRHRWQGYAWHWSVLAAALLTTALGIVLLITELPQVVASFVPTSWEDRIGASEEAALFKRHHRCETPSGQLALDTLMARLRAAGGVVRPVTIAVLNDPQVNAFALPGGHVLVMRGLIDTVDDGPELAAVIAHELGHVAHDDPTTLMVRRMGIGLLAAAMGWNDALGTAANFGGDFVTMAYSRQAEAAADAASQQFLTAAGLRADGLGRFFDRMEQREGQSHDIPWLATHPPTEERRAHATTSTAGAPPFTDMEWAALRSICR